MTTFDLGRTGWVAVEATTQSIARPSSSPPLSAVENAALARSMLPQHLPQWTARSEQDSKLATLAPSATVVFGIQELFEAVLERVPEETLQTSQGVCKHWKDTIKKSPQLQRKLFLLKEEPQRAFILERGCTWDQVIVRPPVCVNDIDSNQMYTIDARLNPMFGERDDLLRAWHGPRIDHWREFSLTRDLDKRASHGELVKLYIVFPLELMPPSWLDMYVTQPPAKMALYDDGRHIIENEDGLRMRDVADFFVHNPGLYRRVPFVHLKFLSFAHGQTQCPGKSLLFADERDRDFVKARAEADKAANEWMLGSGMGLDKTDA